MRRRRCLAGAAGRRAVLVAQLLALTLAPWSLGGCTIAGPLAEKGLPNFARVDEHLLRGAQPASAGYDELARMGVGTVVDLRQRWERRLTRTQEQAEVEHAHMQYVWVPLNGFDAPSVKEARTVLDAIQSSPKPVFLHCEHGADRTGTIVALYRITHDCWTADAAIKEARDHGMAWYEFSMRRFIREWYQRERPHACLPAPQAPPTEAAPK